jgi:ketopantoate reductase
VSGVAEADLAGPTTVLLAVKSHQTQAAVEDLVAALPAGSPVVSLQNGVANEPALLRFFADVQGVCVMMPEGHLEPGVVEEHCTPVPGILDVGAVPGGVTGTTRRVAAAFATAGFVSEPRTDISVWKRRKLITNLGNAVQACCGDDDPDADRLLALVGAEGGGRWPPRASAWCPRRRTGPAAATSCSAPSRPAGCEAAGRRGRACAGGQGSIEFDYLNGEVVLLGRLHGVPTPANELLQRTAARLAREGAAPGSVRAADLLGRLG